MIKTSFVLAGLLATSAVQAQSLQEQRSADEVISRLEVYDLKSDTHRVIHEFPYRIEAPNWSPDGKWIVYNSHGRLYRLSAQNPQEEPVMIDTQSAKGCNNDHVISPDGCWIGISDQWPSLVFRVPFEGGTPVRITDVGPSYLHGISPDGQEVAYCAFRGDKRAIYTKRLNGEPERWLTDADGLNDGPEYAPDGKHIWFNSSRTGDMQIWRMNTDGSEQTQMTALPDLYAWFPHVSPNGKWVCYICYRKTDIKADEHLLNLNVVLRLMESNGRNDRTIVELFGGQGTINVNSWSPDSEKFAYVSYELK
uniref:TolB family protein n=1 Tax=Prevotella sp. GTC17254 TaxID=3236794 RepID=A0AB33J0S2_9BACT